VPDLQITCAPLTPTAAPDDQRFNQVGTIPLLLLDTWARKTPRLGFEKLSNCSLSSMTHRPPSSPPTTPGRAGAALALALADSELVQIVTILARTIARRHRRRHSELNTLQLYTTDI
jgi:hypothetical protein